MTKAELKAMSVPELQDLLKTDEGKALADKINAVLSEKLAEAAQQNEEPERQQPAKPEAKSGFIAAGAKSYLDKLLQENEVVDMTKELLLTVKFKVSAMTVNEYDTVGRLVKLDGEILTEGGFLLSKSSDGRIFKTSNLTVHKTQLAKLGIDTEADISAANVVLEGKVITVRQYRYTNTTTGEDNFLTEVDWNLNEQDKRKLLELCRVEKTVQTKPATNFMFG